MIVSRQNRKIKDIRRLRRCKGDRAILEGPHLIADALQASLALEQVLATPEFMDRAAGRLLVRDLQQPPTLVTSEILDGLCDADSPRGILAVTRVERPALDEMKLPPERFFVVGEGIQDPGNVGALARSTEAAGGDALALTSGSAHPNHPRSLRGSAGSLLRLPTAAGVELPVLRRFLASRPCPVVALVAHGGRDLYSCTLDEPLVLLVGAEGAGLSDEAAALADQAITIPLAGAVESLNTAVAASIVMFEIRRRSVDLAVSSSGRTEP